MERMLIKVFTYRLIFFLFFLALGAIACKKYLDKPISNSVVIPSTLKDLQALLDNFNTMNRTSVSLTEIAADNFYVTTPTWQHYFSINNVGTQGECLNYIWDKNAVSDISWNFYRTSIYYSNIVLEILPEIKVTDDNKSWWNSIKGAALYYRAFAFQRLAQLYCKPYSSSTSVDLGIPLRLNANEEEISVRSTVQQTYDQIINDLKQAAQLLPDSAAYKSRPSKAAVYGTLARTYLSMRDYVDAAQYADACLKINNTLLDYNFLDSTSSAPIPLYTSNPEVIGFSSASSGTLTSESLGLIDTILLRSYSPNDLRRIIFFKQTTDGFGFKGSYASVVTSASSVFDGITVDEMYLIRAECYAVTNNISAAMADLNTLLRKRWKKGTYTDKTANNIPQALDIIRAERRKELVYRGLRWEDLRRMNLENGGNGDTLKRVIDGRIYTLPPNDLRWTMLIPWTVINLSGMQQNPR